MPETNGRNSDYRAAFARRAAAGAHSYPVPDAPDVNETPSTQNVLDKVVPSGQPNITQKGAIENSPAFKDAAQKAYVATNNGNSKVEAGFGINRDGRTTPVSTHEQEGIIDRNGIPTSGSLDQKYDGNTAALLHTHNNVGQAKPSDQDVAMARQMKRPLMVASRDGLYEVDALGDINHVFNSPDFMQQQAEKKYTPPPGYPANWTEKQVTDYQAAHPNEK